MSQLNLNELESTRKRMLAFFESQSDKHFSGSVDGLVSVQMNGRLEILSVKLLNEHSPANRSKLEQAIAKAANQAIREVLKANVEHFATGFTPKA